MNEVKIIKHGPKITFNVEIELSVKQLELLAELSGYLNEDTGTVDEEMVESYLSMNADDYEEPVTSNPFFDSGLGGDINEILSYGFMAVQKLQESNLKTKLALEDVWLHPMLHTYREINNIGTNEIPVQVVSPYREITMARDPHTGEIISADEAARRQAIANRAIQDTIDEMDDDERETLGL